MWFRFSETVRPLWSPKRVVILAFVLGCLLGGLVLTAAYTAHISVQGCERVKRLELITVMQLQRVEKTLPTSVYYRAHPVELAQQQRAIHDEIKAYAPEQCSVF